MARKLFAGLGIALFVFVCLALTFVSATEPSATISSIRCNHIDPLVKPNSELLSKVWNESIGRDCIGQN